MTCHLIYIKPVPKPMLTYCQLGTLLRNNSFFQNTISFTQGNVFQYVNSTMSAIFILASMFLVNNIMTSSNGHIFCVTGPLWGEFTGHRWIPLTKASDVKLLFDLCLNKLLSKQSRQWWFEMPMHSLWCHCNEFIVVLKFSFKLFIDYNMYADE